MNKIKVCPRIHLFIIISALFIAIGMAVGTICHFVSNGFFNFGGEFSSYNCVTVTYDSLRGADTIKPICEKALNDFDPYEVSVSEIKTGGEIVFKYKASTSVEKLQEAVDELNKSLKVAEGDELLGVASLHQGVVEEGGDRAVKLAAIAVASAAAAQFIYFIIRFKLRAAFSALLSNIHNLGIFVALAAITRMPVGTEFTAIAAAVVVVSMIFSCLLFDRTRKNFKSDKYEKTDRKEVIEISASETRVYTLVACSAIAVAAVIVAVFAAISSLSIAAAAPAMLAVFGAIACCYGCLFFTPAVHSAIDETCEEVKGLIKSSKGKQPAKTEEKTAVKEA